MSVSAVIAAAGLSARMHDFKPLLCLGDSTIIHHTITALQKAGAKPIVVVTGYQSAVLERHLKTSGVMFVKNERYVESDMLTSMQLGLSAVFPDTDQVFVTPADIPLVSSETLELMLKTPGDIVQPSCQGRRGHPLLLRQKAVQQVLSWQGPCGLKGLLHSGILDVTSVETGDPGILMDADTPQDYKALIRYQTRLHGHGNLRMDLQLSIGMEELFLTIENVQLLDMIGQTGSLQNACACMHISYSKGWKAIKTMEKQLGFPVTQRTAGGLDGGGSVLTSRGAELLTCYRLLHQKVSDNAKKLFDECFPDYLRNPHDHKEDLV